MPHSKIPSTLMAVMWVVLGLKVADVLYRLAKSLGSGFDGASVFLRAEFGNLTTLVLLTCVVYLLKTQSHAKAA